MADTREAGALVAGELAGGAVSLLGPELAIQVPGPGRCEDGHHGCRSPVPDLFLPARAAGREPVPRCGPERHLEFASCCGAVREEGVSRHAASTYRKAASLTSPTGPYDALLLLSFGGPEGPDDVVPFLQNVTRGRGIPKERLKEVGQHYFLFG
ncbi:hypothetical protein ACF09M_35810, partial [Streptomyces griseosporeus]